MEVKKMKKLSKDILMITFGGQLREFKFILGEFKELFNIK